MTFREGLLYTYKNRRTDGEITDPFYLYCRLSDLSSSSYEDKKKVELFYAVDRRLCVFETLIKRGENGQNELLNSYMVVSELLSEDSFKKLIECAVWAMNPTAQIHVGKIEKENKSIPQKPQKIKPVKAEESQEEETRTPLTSSYVGGGDTDVIIGLSIMGGALLAIVLFIVFACVFNWSWTVWQWLIGIVGGIILSAILVGIVAWFEEECLADYYVLGTFVLGICVLLNFILLLIFKGNYKVIFGWFSGFELIIGAILAFVTCDDCEDGWGVAQIVEVAITIISFIIAMISF